jgi:hypothetical protein
MFSEMDLKKRGMVRAGRYWGNYTSGRIGRESKRGRQPLHLYAIKFYNRFPEINTAENKINHLTLLEFKKFCRKGAKAVS